jgi:trimethylamine--corrinoid protein Co-methyltransferase
MKILEQIGLQIVNDRARRIMQEHGASIDARTGYVKMDRDMVMKKISTIPDQFTLHARNPKFDSIYGGNHINFTLVASAPNCSDLDGGRRTGNFADFCKFLKLGQTFNVIAAHSGYPVEPIDLPAHTRHLDAYQAFITLTEKPWHAYSLGNGKVEDAIEMICMARGIDKETLKRQPSIMTVVNTNSPLKVDVPMLDGLMMLAEFGQPVVVTPFTLSGAMSPVTLAGAISQQNAEALGVLAVTQMINPGAPAMYGGFTSNVDMKSGAPAFGTPEYAKAVFAGGQLARRYSIPYRTSNVNASNCVDAQATWESGMSLWSAVMSHGNMIKHSGGWLEGGLCASFEKLIVDMEMVQMMSEMLKPLQVNESELALEAIREVGAGGHFFGTSHTIDRYKDAFYSPINSDWSNFETWQEKGSIDATQRANKLYKQLLNDYQEPELDPGIREQISEYVGKRKREIKSDW